MSLPIRTTLDDIRDVCQYLATKPAGATIKEAKTVLDSSRLDGRKLMAMKFWNLIYEEDEKLKLSTLGRDLVKSETHFMSALQEIIRNTPPYLAIVERAAHRNEVELTSTDVAAHWHDHFREYVGDSDRILNDQAICFFHVAVGAGLGTMIAGRYNNPTRINFVSDTINKFVRGQSIPRTLQTPLKSTPQKNPTKSKAPEPEENIIHEHDDVEPDVRITSSAEYLQRGLKVDCYKLIERLGSGFSAEVWSATVMRVPPGVELEKGQKVAIKFYTANALAIPDQVIRIEREYRVAQRLRHPHLIRIYEFVLASPRPNHNFLVMDIAEGKTLSQTISISKKIEPKNALQIIAQLFSGADALHSSGALHRDIKPGNIAINKKADGSPHSVLLDLGIVSPMFEKGVTAVSRFVGSKHWAPLEQLIGHALDERSDIYSIGAVGYNLLMGVEPYSSSATEAAVAVTMTQSGLEIPHLSDFPSEIIEMLNACLSNKPDDRPRNARECLALLEKHGVHP